VRGWPRGAPEKITIFSTIFTVLILKTGFVEMVNLCLFGRECGRIPGFFVALPGDNRSAASSR
jgi:hypothetical protein